MTSHHDTLAAFDRALNGGPLPHGVTALEPSEAEQRFNVYRNNVMVSLTEALTEYYRGGGERIADDYEIAIVVNGRELHRVTSRELAGTSHFAVPGDQIDAGEKAAWGLYALSFPYGAHYPYNFGTVNWFSSMAHLDAESVPFADRVEAIHPTLTMDQVSHMVNKTRKLTEGELWMTIDHVHNDDFAAGRAGSGN